MNSYSLNISLSWLIASLAFLIAAGISYFYYKNTESQISLRQKYTLQGLRTIALCLLLFILFEPVFSHIAGKIIEPRIAVMLDNSLSMSLKDGKFDRKEIYRQVVEKTSFLFKQNNPVILFDSDVKLREKATFDSLKFDGQMTDISAPFDFISSYEKNNNIKAVVLVTDGANNSGGNPIYSAEKIGKPVYIIGIGDTSTPRDLSVKSLITNENIAINSTVPVNVNFKVYGFGQQKVNIGLYNNSEKIGSQTIDIYPDRQDYSLVFEYKATKSGTRKLTARADDIAGEISNKNNSVSEFVNVNDKKKKIVILAGEPSPDLTFIINAFAKDKTTEIRKFVQKYKSEFYDKAPTQSDLQSADAYYLIGFPNFSSPVGIIQMLRSELEKNKPLFFIASQDMDYSKLKPLESFLPFTVMSSNSREYSATAQFSEKSKSNPLTRITGDDADFAQWNDLPPLFRTETFVKVKPESQIIANVKVNTSVLNEPFILSRQFANQKTIAVLGYGLYRWKLTGFAQDQYRKNSNKYDLYTRFIENSNQWLTTDPDKKNVTIKPVRRVFLKNDKIEFFAQVNDVAMNPVDNADVKVIISGGNADNEITLNSSGNGQYHGFAENLAQGEYYYKGKAQKNGTILGEDKGKFVIGDLPLEYQDIRMNRELLMQIAERTGGKFYFNDKIHELENDIKTHKSFTKDDIVVKSETALWNEPILLALSILFFAIEWFFRKRFGLL